MRFVVSHRLNFMHQTFYIDIDEEITSVVERLRKARADEVVLVVPKRALLIQSIVNLRLLRKEAENIGLSIMVVTQDKLGKLLVEKAGILVQQKVDDLGEDEIIASENDSQKMQEQDISRENNFIHQKKDKDGRLSQIGSDNFFDNSSSQKTKLPPPMEKVLPAKKDVTQGESEKITNKELVTGLTEDIRKKSTPVGIDSMRTDVSFPKQKEPQKRVSLPVPAERQVGFDSENLSSLVNAGQKGDTDFSEKSQDRKIENFFHSSSFSREESPKNDFSRKETGVVHVSRNFKKIFLVFGLIFVLAVSLAAGYLFLPKATIFITTKSKTKTVEAEMTGNVAVLEADLENSVIPGKEVSVSEEISDNYPVSGSKKVSVQKSHGKITIYNEFSSSPQPLVATTRFLSDDGKLFRLVSSVTVPGTKKDGESVVSGEVEAEVAADESGEEYNIGPSKFSIPGFKDSGGGKYEKIYAKSEGSMTGGGNEGNLANSLSQTDIDQAKENAVANLKSVAKEKLERAAGEGEVILEDAINIEEPTYKVSNSPGEVVDNFELKVQLNAKVIAFKKADIESVLAQKIKKTDGLSFNAQKDKMDLDFGKTNVDYKAGTVDVKVHGTILLSSGIDAQNLKKGALGKTNDELKNYLSSYSDIEKVEISYWPVFLSSRIPFYEKRVFVEVSSSDKNSSN